jgi:hypothetical protein
MQKIAISYADRGFVAAQRENARTALSVGGFDTALCYRRHHLGLWFRWRRRRILRQPRGAGYWVWKPYLIRHTLRQMRDGDILFYSDCDARFVSSIDPLLPILSGLADPGIIVFSLEDFHINRIWTKRDCFHYLGLDTSSYIDGQQVAAGLFICRRSRPTLAFVEEWLAAVLDARIVTDAPNVCGLPNYPGFRDHRHDQSVLSLLARKHGLTTLPDVSQWGDDRRPPNLPRIIELTDRRD